MMRKRVFISSIIAEYIEYREAVAAAARAVNCEVIRSEDFNARPETPQQACINALRMSDIVVFALGATYGKHQSSGLSATHEEWREAIEEQKPILIFVEKVDTREPEQTEFIQEVEQWEDGRLRKSFDSPADLQEKVTQALSDWLLAEASSPADKADMIAHAEQALPKHQPYSSGDSSLLVVVAGGRHFQILRPTELQDDQLCQDLQQAAMFGANPPLSSQEATRLKQDQTGRLVIGQASASITLDNCGTILIEQPSALNQREWFSGIPSIIEEDICEILVRALRFVSKVLDMIDDTNRITDVVALAVFHNTNVRPWRTMAEYAASPNSATLDGDRSGVIVGKDQPTIRRSNLYHQAERIAGDLCVLLKQAGNTRRFFET